MSSLGTVFGEDQNFTLFGKPGTFVATKKAIPLSYRVAETECVVPTLEGRVKCHAGDVIITGTKGEEWPVRRGSFDSTYDRINEYQASKKPIETFARQMSGPFTVHVPWRDSALKGETGDFLVEYEKGDFGVVSKDIFKETYRRQGGLSEEEIKDEINRNLKDLKV